MHIKLTCKYCGTKFSGFQTQKGKRTVQAELEKAISKYFGKNIKVVGAGRTDAGVHAEGQVISFLLPENAQYPLNELADGINAILPKDISVRDAEIKEKFNAREAAKSKTYIYRCYLGRQNNALEKTSYRLNNKPNIDMMRKASKLFVGTHDFSFFCDGLSERNPVRTIQDIEIKEEDYEILFIIRGISFLKKMVRIIVGALLETGDGKLSPQDIEEMFKNGFKCKKVKPVPAKGLTLFSVEF